MSEEIKKEMQNAELNLEDLDKVAGGDGFDSSVAPKVDAILKAWDRYRVILASKINSTSDPVAKQQLQETYDLANSDSQMFELWHLAGGHYITDEEELRAARTAFWSTFDYDHYWNWFNSL